jgi:hypothetical protein
MTLNVLFKDDMTCRIKMIKVTLFIQRELKNQEKDDIVRVHSTVYPNMFKVVYSSPDMKKMTQFTATRFEVMDYVSSILKSLSEDAQPFAYVQLTTAMHPSILYPVESLDDRTTRNDIEDIVYMALKANAVSV